MQNELEEFGVNYFADFNAVTGIGEAVRGNVSALSLQGVNVKKIHIPLSENQYPFLNDFDSTPEYDINIFHHNPGFQFKKILKKYPPTFFKNKYNIAYWAWETDIFPKRFHAYLDLIDEIWVPSTFVKKSIAKVTDKPICVIPHQIEIENDDSICFNALNLPEDSFVFLNVFDYGSTIARKNTLELIETFKQSFNETENVWLVLKALPNSSFSRDMYLVHTAISNHQRIILIEDILKQNELMALKKRCQVYISMHCAEGFGINLAQAMLLGKPVIATGYSGNMDFMNHENSFPIPFKLSKIKSSSKTFSPKTIWAYPDMLEAGKIMRWVVENYESASKIAAKGKKFIQENLSPNKIGSLMTERLRLIERNKIQNSKKTNSNLYQKLKSLIRF